MAVNLAVWLMMCYLLELLREALKSTEACACLYCTVFQSVFDIRALKHECGCLPRKCNSAGALASLLTLGTFQNMSLSIKTLL